MRNYSSRNKGPRYDRNEYIKAKELRIIDDAGENLGLMSREEALDLARGKELDLVLLDPNSDVPVAKIIDWSKFKYLQSKKLKQKSKSATVKEWWFKPKIEERDILNKLKNAEKYLKKGAKVKITIKYKRRASYDDMRDTLNRVLELSEEFAEKASDINKEGRNLSVFLKAKK